MKFLRFVFAALLGVASAASGAGAVTRTASIPISMTSANGCSQITANAMAFGSIASGNSTTGQTQILVTCTNGTPYTLLLDAGNYCRTHTGCPGARVAVDAGADQVDYNFYKDVSETQLWGDGNVSFNATGQAGTGNGSQQTWVVYGLVVSSASNPAGVYSDTATATVSF